MAREAMAPVAGTCLLTPPPHHSLVDGIASNRRINDCLLDRAPRLGGRACGVVEPRFGEAAVAEMRRIAGAGAAGVVFSPRAQGVFANDHVMLAMCNEAAASGLVAMIRCAPYSINESLPRIWELARQCADTRIVVFGAFASWENIQQVRWNAGGPANVVYDLSGLVEDHDLLALVQDLGASRLLFGSGGPAYVAALLKLIDGCGLDGSTRDAILSVNARRLLDARQ
jgi:predicted TIM-barrel fold metal-dependent hydrolase